MGLHNVTTVGYQCAAQYYTQPSRSVQSSINFCEELTHAPLRLSRGGVVVLHLLQAAANCIGCCNN